MSGEPVQAPCQLFRAFFASERAHNPSLTTISDAGVSQWDKRPMEIKGTGSIGPSAVRRKSTATTGGSGFTVSDTAEPHAHIVSGPGPIAALDSILALQDMGNPTDGRSKGLRHGEQLLEILDSVRDGLL